MGRSAQWLRCVGNCSSFVRLALCRGFVCLANVLQCAVGYPLYLWMDLVSEHRLKEYIKSDIFLSRFIILFFRFFLLLLFQFLPQKILLKKLHQLPKIHLVLRILI